LVLTSLTLKSGGSVRTFFVLLLVIVVVAVGAGITFGVVTFTTTSGAGQWSVTATVHTDRLSALDHSASAQELLLDVKGKVVSVDPEKNVIVVSENVKNWTFRLAKNSKVLLNDRESNLAQLKAGDDATVSFTRQDQEMIATVVHCTRK
jgi:hypothetical protein